MTKTDIEKALRAVNQKAKEGPGRKNMGRQGFKTLNRTPQNEENKMTKSEYLTAIIKDNINLYARSFERTERPKIAAILKYYGLEIDEDMSYDLRWDEFWEGNKSLTMTWWCFEPYGSIETSICY